MTGDVDTLTFVDVDGVLNVGIRDGHRAPLVLNEANVGVAHGCQDGTFPTVQYDSVAKVVSAADRFKDLICAGGTQYSEVLIRRLVDILRAGGERQSVVLSSSWRKSKHSGIVEQLQHEISKHLAEVFEFHARTEVVPEVRAADRLRSIGDFVTKHCAERGCGSLRVLILDDFFATGLNGWACDGVCMHEAQDVEAYLQQRAPEAWAVHVKLVHSYEEWATPDGVRIQAGVGLSDADVEAAREFFDTAERGWAWADVVAVQREMARRSSKFLFDRMTPCDLTDKEVAVSPAVCWAGLLSLARFLCLHV